MGIKDEILKEEPMNLDIISSLTKNLIDNEKKSKETIIYRIAMTLYHSDRFWESHILKILNDPMRVYLSLASNKKFQEEYDEIWNLINKKKSRMIKANFIKTLLCFLIATYLYYNNLDEVE